MTTPEKKTTDAKKTVASKTPAVPAFDPSILTGARPMKVDKKTPLTDKEWREKNIKDHNAQEMRTAKSLLKKFSGTPEYSALPADIQAAMIRVIGKVGGGGTGRTGSGSDSFAATLRTMFVKVSDSLDEFDVFKATKMGRGEFRKRVRESLKKAAFEDRQWVEFNETTEEWELLARGKKMPKGFRGKAIDMTAEELDALKVSAEAVKIK